MTLTFKEVSEIMKIIDTSEAEEIVLELEGFRLVVRRNGAASPSITAAAPAATTPSPAPPATNEQPASQPAPTVTPAASATIESGTQVRAPMVGSFYRKPSPDQPPFS